MGPTRLSTWLSHSRSVAGKSAFVILLILTIDFKHVSGMEQAYIEDAERFPGWKGELPNSFHVKVDDSVGYKEGGNVCLYFFYCVIMALDGVFAELTR